MVLNFLIFQNLLVVESNHVANRLLPFRKLVHFADELLFDLLRILLHIVESLDHVVVFVYEISQSNLFGHTASLIHYLESALKIDINLLFSQFCTIPHQLWGLELPTFLSESLALFSYEVEVPKFLNVFVARILLCLKVVANLNIFVAVWSQVPFLNILNANLPQIFIHAFIRQFSFLFLGCEERH